MNDMRIEEIEYQRITTALEPILDEIVAGASPLLRYQQVGLVMLASLAHQAARWAAKIGMSRADFDKRVAQMADKVYNPAPGVVEVPKIIV